MSPVGRGIVGGGVWVWGLLAFLWVGLENAVGGILVVVGREVGGWNGSGEWGRVVG